LAVAKMSTAAMNALPDLTSPVPRRARRDVG
jgi:hypothetical protein